MVSRYHRSKPLQFYWSSPERRARQCARTRVRYLVLTGKLRREVCECCGGSPVVMFHPNYLRRDVVRWLCRAHYRERLLAIAAGDAPAQVAAIDDRQLALFNLGGPNG